MTRAKAAAGTAGDPPKKALATKKPTILSTTGTLGARKRTALGDVSNVAKVDTSKDAKKGLKPLGAKAVKPLTTQAQPARPAVAKPVGQQYANSNSAERKRPASTTSVGPVLKKRHTISNEDVEEEAENVPPPKNGSYKSAKARSSKSSDKVYEDDELDIATLKQLSKQAKDLDAEDVDDPLMVAEYVHEIFDYMKELEVSTMPNPDYMDGQSELEWKMRGILVDWLLEVHTRFRLLPETLFLAVNIIDRFLSSKVVQLDRLQLVGVTAMFIASKYEEVLSPHVQNFKHVADDGFTEAEILTAERFVLQALNYDLSYPNPMNFLRRISKADNYDIQTRTLGKYLLEIGCLDHRFLKYPPSRVAAAAMYLARLTLEKGEWDATLSHYAGYTEQDIQPVFKLMVEYLAGPVDHEAFFRKYASKKFLKGMTSRIRVLLHLTDFYAASIVLRSWAKKYAPVYLDSVAEHGSKTLS